LWSNSNSPVATTAAASIAAVRNAAVSCNGGVVPKDAISEACRLAGGDLLLNMKMCFIVSRRRRGTQEPKKLEHNWCPAWQERGSFPMMWTPFFWLDMHSATSSPVRPPASDYNFFHACTDHDLFLVGIIPFKRKFNMFKIISLNL
jgi:hypothetical protein